MCCHSQAYWDALRPTGWTQGKGKAALAMLEGSGHVGKGECGSGLERHQSPIAQLQICSRHHWRSSWLRLAKGKGKAMG